MAKVTTRQARLKRHLRVRLKVSGTKERPRLSVFRSLNHIYAQIIDDSEAKTLVSASTLDGEVKEALKDKKKTDEAKVIGKLLAERALSHEIGQVVFDRGGYRYHGRVKALAEGAREAGLKF